MTDGKIILHPKRARSAFNRHPWVFAGAVQAVEGNPADGAAVDVFSAAGHFIAKGFYNSRSKIRVRLYSWQSEQSLDEEFFRQRISAAIRLRSQLLKPEAGSHATKPACRLVASEGDGLSGLTVDQYDRWLAVQFTSLAMGQRRQMIADQLSELTGVRGIYARTEKGIGQLEGLELHDGPLWGEIPELFIEVCDGTIRFNVDIREGQKTGFFLDQRSNRKAAAAYLTGRTVLDCFCYSGGFALHAVNAGARHVEAVDASEAALNLAAENARINGIETIEFVKANVFDHLKSAITTGRKFGAVILDPPKFARARRSIVDALRGYRVLLSQAMRLLEPEGILVMCCCSGLISALDVESVIAQVAVHARRDLQILGRRGQDFDHPINVACPESEYLKCFICRVL